MWIPYNNQTKSDIKYEILARHIVSQIKYLHIQANFCKIYILSSNHKKWKWSRRNEEIVCGTQIEATTP